MPSQIIGWNWKICLHSYFTLARRQSCNIRWKLVFQAQSTTKDYLRAVCTVLLLKLFVYIPPVKGGRRQRKRWEDNIREWTGLKFGKSQRAVENGGKWRKLVAKSSVVPQRPSRLRARWDERWDVYILQYINIMHDTTDSFLFCNEDGGGHLECRAECRIVLLH